MNSQNIIPPSQPLLSRADIGSNDWWDVIENIGTPLQQPLSNGDIELTFLWRDPQGNQSDYACIYLDVYSHTPHPTRAQTSMDRIENTNVWHWQTILPADWCGSYFLMPAKTNQLPPAAADRKALRSWWINLMRIHAQPDALNKLPSHNSGWGLSLSAIQLPNAKIHPAWQHNAINFNGQLQHHRWASKRLGNERQIWLYRTGEEKNLPLVILLDGHYWAEHMPIFVPLDYLTAQGQLPPAHYLFIDAINPTVRATELPCNQDFWIAIQEELLPELNVFISNPQKTLVAGQSFGGLSALYAALHWPEKFGLALSQSGSFWWPDADETGNQGQLTQHVLNGLGRDKNLKVLLEIGCYEEDMLGVNRAMFDALRQNHIDATYREFRGGHDWICWRNGLLQGLCQLMS